MKSRRTFGLSLVALITGVYALAVFWEFNAPEIPFFLDGASEVAEIHDISASGSLQAGDLLLQVNGEREYGCLYITPPPLYRASRGVPIPVTYQRQPSGSTIGETRSS
jgi:hypothetical protein